MGDHPSRVLADHLARAQTELTALAGSRALCAIARSGDSYPAAKYAEGAVSALAEVRRSARRQDILDDPVRLAALTGAIATRWKERADRMIDAGRDWAAYLSGGSDALTALVEDLPDGTG
jgi:hypothetical protein